jgi:arylsulfatase A-like enzyme
MTKLSRRDFLKLLAVSSAGLVTSSAHPTLASENTPAAHKPTILIFVLDAMSARHLSLYGYGRETTPNLAKFASHANVYHSHYSEANFTSAGTATLLSGLHPWEHRAFNLGGLVRRELIDRNLFRWLGGDYYRVAFTQNSWADLLLRQYRNDLEVHLPITSFSYAPKRPMLSASIAPDDILAYYSYDEFMSFSYKLFNPLPGSLFLGTYGASVRQSAQRLDQPSDEYPFGVPSEAFFFYFHNAEVFAGVTELVQKSVNPLRPVLGYFHLYAPHGTYCPRREFTGIFPEIEIPSKPLHPLAILQLPQETLYDYRKHYDEYIANVDAEFGKMMDTLEKDGILERCYVLVTSDHGEGFERGEFGHGTYLLYEPVIRVPLLISTPGQKERADISSPTSNADIVPTLLTLAGEAVPAELTGRVLPGFGGGEDFQRSIFALEAKESSAFQPLKTATVALIKEGRKLIYYTGYPEYPEAFELYDLNENGEEMKNLFEEDTVTAALMKEELLDMLAEINRPFTKK